jgi:hypothetical protein
MTTSQTNNTSGGTQSPTTEYWATHIGVSDEDRLIVARVIDALKCGLDGEPSDLLVDEVVTKLTRMPGSDSAEALRPLVKCLPANVATMLPKILEAQRAPAKTAVLSYVGKDVMYRMETAIVYGSAFLALTDLECDAARQFNRS